ncbi:YggS family pyridoxal phosphate-dependent enzyme [Clostridium estertheticum]|uniref:Pyridoxal phosphate homeostasis protein n=1 Tax=Clostridium estertheticum subsp. estertheticum TaxID=1552 RepID=A0A1J0GIF4_9CLOT|nr:YggS family pyridoxal phosphate-dependent enzyme [Clostridium estertheticum]APC41109.1 YggS family pyridoxal phosphate enzyme [Clostridium estertheticum subsp. estertheticum]MBU3074115.1 YggS family pyridoxal phosphate-dependent enzyme [Clostridium estertheticum]MBU3164209.1 YggS family pyridoxal phosphate-dependent enzyme [Clostridium estertheticum]MBU3170144.1 YggS family pyridoxal phosphate-dependent enzyme [Clostridium estertheticum]MBU3186066.1 YggS family pyridoxal phosphate-dependent
MSIGEVYNKIKNEIPENVTLICVSKTRQISEIKEAYDSGARDFGENKVQEFLEKYDSIGKDIRWHFIGHLQTNKVKYIVGKVHLIHSLDSIHLLKEIEKRYGAKNEIANVLIQINIGNEIAKTGVAPEEMNDLIKACEECNNVKVKGLMATIPIGDDESSRKYFAKMKAVFDDLKTYKYKNVSMEFLSLGMSKDFPIALEQGANMIRLGTKIFGKRDYKKLEAL